MTHQPMLTIKELAPYAPYKLKIFHYGKQKIMTVGAGSSNNWIGMRAVLNGANSGNWEEYRPILWPLNFLTKPIEHNGEKIIPLQILFSIATGINYFNNEPIDLFDYRKVKNGCYLAYELNRSIAFHYDSISRSFRVFNDDESMSEVKEQLQLFDKLFEWHFDVFGLIDKGLAIDKSTIK